jgi:DNA polymerase III gamma/tau subunit
VFKSLRKTEIVKLIEEVCAFEAIDFGKDLLSAIADAAEGSPRNALVQLQKVIQLGMPSLEEATNVLNSGEQSRPEAYQLASMFYFGKTSWPKLMELYEEMKDMGAPAIGMVMAGTYRNKLIKSTLEGDASRLGQALELFVEPFMEGKPGENQLVLALFKTYSIFKQAKAATKNVSY